VTPQRLLAKTDLMAHSENREAPPKYIQSRPGKAIARIFSSGAMR